MVNSSYTLHPYTEPYLNRREPHRKQYDHPRWQDYSSFPSTDGDTCNQADLTRVILAGITSLANTAQEAGNRSYVGSPFSLPARVEMVWEKDSTYGARGAVIFDSFGRLIVHVVDALLGYSGSGAALGDAVLSALNVTDRMASEIHQAVAHQPYHLVISREKTTIAEGVEITLPTADVMPEWRWWRVT